MKTLLLIAKIVIASLLFLDLFYWMAIYGSGHRIPEKTEMLLAIYALILIVILLLLFFVPRKMIRNN